MGLSRQRLLVSVAVVVGLLFPAATATAASDGDAHKSGKQALLQQMSDRARIQAQVSPEPKVLGGPLSRLAARRQTDRVVIAIKVRPGANGAVRSLATVVGSAGAQGAKQRQTLQRLGTFSVEVPEATATAFMAQMRGRADVAKVELVPRRSLSYIPTDPMYAATAPYLNAVTAPEAWDVKKAVSSVKIAVVDSGMDVFHPDLIGRVDPTTYNADTGGTDVTDELGHGTFVAGVAAATGDNGTGIAGAAFGTSLLAVKVADAWGDIWTDTVSAGIVWAADHGAKVINLSLGSTTPSQIESDAIAYAVAKGILVVAAAGNEFVTTPSYPAAYPQVVAVGATNVSTGGRASFSNYGPWVTVGAPGVGIKGTAPVIGSALFLPEYDVGDGTSLSSPIVAAEAALLWSLRPDVSSSDIRAAIVKSAHGYPGLGLGTGQVDFRAAQVALTPVTVPVLTRPVDGAIVTGVVQLSATSTAPKVGFKVGNVLIGTPVDTIGGVASTTWTSWGVANGPLTWTAVDCSIRELCNTAPSQVNVTLANAAPVVTSPRTSQVLSGTATFTATATGGGVAFIIDGVRRGFDGSPPYALTYPISSLADGTHTVKALSCSATGTACAGPGSSLVSFTARSLHPRFTAVSPVLFSPNGDGRNDTTKATYYLPDTESVTFQVRNAVGTIVRGPTGLGTQTAGSRTLIWNGLLNGGARAANGSYVLQLATTRATSTGTLVGSAVANVSVDTTAPTMTSITGGATTFYPHPDSYRDIFRTTFTLSERATVTMTVRTGTGALVRTVAATLGAGATSLAWNGKNTAGAQVPAGTYYWTLVAQDAAGNRRATARYSLIVSAKYLVTKTATLSVRGAQYSVAGGSLTSCAWADKTASDFSPYGVWLVNACDSSWDGPQIAGATYRFAVPAAFSYTSLAVASYGNSLLAPSTLGAGFTRWGTTDYTFTPEISVVHTNAWRTLGTVAATALVSSARVVQTTLYVPNDYTSASDYDVSYVRLVVTYKVFV